MPRRDTALTASEMAEIRYRYELAETWLQASTWEGRVKSYGPVIAQTVLRSFADIPRLLEALDG